MALSISVKLFLKFYGNQLGSIIWNPLKPVIIQAQSQHNIAMHKNSEAILLKLKRLQPSFI